MIVRDTRIENNVNGRTGCFLHDGPRTHTVRLVDNVILIVSSEGQKLEELHDLWTNYEMRDFVVRTMDARVSGFDGRALVGCFGFDANTGNSREVYVKGNRTYDSGQ